jgi:acyl-CoA thioester hydrolase
VPALPCITTLRVRYAETDRMGVVYYSNYLVWFEVGRADLMRVHGRTYRELEEQGVILPVIEARCEYRQPARYDEEIEIRTTGELLSPVRLKFTYEIVRPADASVLAAGHTMHAAVDARGKPCRLPDWLREAFA